MAREEGNDGGLRINCWMKIKMVRWAGILAAYGVLAFNIAVSCLPVESSRDVNMTNIDSSLQMLNKEIKKYNTPNRITKIYHLKNATVIEGNDELRRSLFSNLLNEIGWSKVENVVPMYWTEITSIDALKLKARRRRIDCNEIFHPDHFLSNVILENLVNTKLISQEKFTDSLMRVFCSSTIKHISLHFSQSDDVISGLVIISIQNDGSVIALVNVGF